MTRAPDCKSCKFHLWMTRLNVAVAVAGVYFAGGLLPAIGLPISAASWAMHYFSCESYYPKERDNATND